MKIRIKTELITLEVIDAPEHTNSSYTNHPLPELIPAIKAAIEQAILLHNSVKNEYRTGNSTEKV